MFSRHGMLLESFLLFCAVLILYVVARLLVPMNGTTNGSFGVSLLNFDSLKRPFTDESKVDVVSIAKHTICASRTAQNNKMILNRSSEEKL